MPLKSKYFFSRSEVGSKGVESAGGRQVFMTGAASPVNMAREGGREGRREGGDVGTNR